MRTRPKSRCYDDETGEIHWGLDSEPELVAWEKGYEDEADRLAEDEAVKTGKKHWGRWYLTKTSLDTIVAMPNVGKDGYLIRGVYDIALDRFDENWVAHMSKKIWMGERGLRDLADAIAEIEAEAMDKLCFGRWWCEDNSLDTVVRYPVYAEDEVASKLFSIPIGKINEDWMSIIEKEEYVGEKGLVDLAEALSFLKVITPSTCGTKKEES